MTCLRIFEHFWRCSATYRSIPERLNLKDIEEFKSFLEDQENASPHKTILDVQMEDIRAYMAFIQTEAKKSIHQPKGVIPEERFISIF